MFAYDKTFHPEVVLGHCDRLPSAPIFPIFSFIFTASYFFLYFDPKSYIFPSNSYIFQNAADNNEFEMPVLMSLAFIFFFARS